MDEFKNLAKETKSVGKLIFAGNGASASIASHGAVDFTKQAKIRAITFNESNLITCLSNDFGYEKAYVKFLEYHLEPQTLVILMSSSGESPNMVNCMEYCEKYGVDYGILTGFSEHNRMRRDAQYAKWNFHVASESYGVVECVHQIFLHGVI